MLFASRYQSLRATLAGLGALCHFASAAPTLEAAGLARRQSITVVSSLEIDSFTPFSNYASAGYCAPSVTSTWSCGKNCEANQGFKPTAAGGDGDDVQFCEFRSSQLRLNRQSLTKRSGFVGFDPNLNTVIVSHQGTDTSEMCVRVPFCCAVPC